MVYKAGAVIAIGETGMKFLNTGSKNIIRTEASDVMVLDSIKED